VKIFFKIVCLSIIISLFSCHQDKKRKRKSTEIEKKDELKKEIEEKITKPWDSLNKDNTEAFLLAYAKQNPETKVVIKTKFGNIELLLYKDVPVHRANFIFLTKIKYFNTTVIYRVAKNFVIQGGNSDNMYTQKQRRKYGNYLMQPEFRDHRTHKFGALAAARQWKKNPNKLSSPFEFYMVHQRNGAHHLDNEHTVFGEVVSGFDTMDKISKVKVGVDEWPVDDINMTIEILD
jgi:cyclophilin family peptidyl-prolyl cis-trans isomerase